MLPALTYDVKFTDRYGATELYTYFRIEDATEHYNMFDESDADIYAKIELIEYNWDTKEQKIISALSL